MKHRTPTRYESVTVESIITSVVSLLYIPTKNICSKNKINSGYIHWQRHFTSTSLKQDYIPENNCGLEGRNIRIKVKEE